MMIHFWLVAIIVAGVGFGIAARAGEVRAAENPYREDIARYDKEVRLACDTVLKDASSARQLVARSTYDRLNSKVAELRSKIEKVNFELKAIEDSKEDKSADELRRARAEHQAALRRYQGSFSDGNLGRESSVDLEESLIKVRETKRRLEQLEEDARQRNSTGSSEEKVKTIKERTSAAHDELAVLIEASDRYQSLRRRVRDCAYREDNEGLPAFREHHFEKKPEQVEGTDTPGTIPKKSGGGSIGF